MFFVETGFIHVGQAGLELPTSGDQPASASQSTGITGVSHYAWLIGEYFQSAGVLAIKWGRMIMPTSWAMVLKELGINGRDIVPN